MTPAMVLEPVTTDMETMFLHRYGNIVLALLPAPHAVLCSGKAYFTLFVHIVVIYLLARMWSKNHETPGGGGSIFQKWSCRSSPWPQRLTTWQVLFNSQKTGQISSFKGDSCFEPLTQQTIMSHVTCFCYFRYILEVTWEFPRCSPQPAYPKTII